MIANTVAVDLMVTKTTETNITLIATVNIITIMMIAMNMGTDIKVMTETEAEIESIVTITTINTIGVEKVIRVIIVTVIMKNVMVINRAEVANPVTAEAILHNYRRLILKSPGRNIDWVPRIMYQGVGVVTVSLYVIRNLRSKSSKW